MKTHLFFFHFLACNAIVLLEHIFKVPHGHYVRSRLRMNELTTFCPVTFATQRKRMCNAKREVSSLEVSQLLHMSWLKLNEKLNQRFLLYLERLQASIFCGFAFFLSSTCDARWRRCLQHQYIDDPAHWDCCETSESESKQIGPVKFIQQATW